MPIIAIPTRAVEKLAELESESRKTDTRWDIAYRYGFVEGLRAVLSSEVVGLIIMEAECMVDGVPGFPRLAKAICEEQSSAEETDP